MRRYLTKLLGRYGGRQTTYSYCRLPNNGSRSSTLVYLRSAEEYVSSVIAECRAVVYCVRGLLFVCGFPTGEG